MAKKAIPESEKVKLLVKLTVEEYNRQTRGPAGRYLNDAMRRALVSDALVDVMLQRYEVEAERDNHTDPNLYVDAVREAWKQLGL